MSLIPVDRRKKIKICPYIISYVDYPEGTFHPDSLDLISEGVVKALKQQAEHLGGNVIYSADMDDLGFKGQLYRIAYKDAKIFVKERASVPIGIEFTIFKCLPWLKTV